MRPFDPSLSHCWLEGMGRRRPARLWRPALSSACALSHATVLTPSVSRSLLSFLLAPRADHKVIVFFTTARFTQYMAALVSAAGIPVLEIHSRKSQVGFMGGLRGWPDGWPGGREGLRAHE